MINIFRSHKHNEDPADLIAQENNAVIFPLVPENKPAPPAPVKEPQRKPSPERQPGTDRPSREKDPSPGRPAPVPGREPRPIIDPKNFLNLLTKEYYHTSRPEIKDRLKNVNPFCAVENPDDIVHFGQEVYKEYSDSLTLLINHPLYKKYKESDLPKKISEFQNRHEDKILFFINKYMEDIMGECFLSIQNQLDLSWYNPYNDSDDSTKSRSGKKSPGFVKSWFREQNSDSAESESEIPDGSAIDWDYLKEVIIRSEVNFLLIQGFSILYMSGFFRMYRRELDSLHPELSEIYELFHLYGRFNHFRTFEDVMIGRNLPSRIDNYMENNQSQGRVWYSSDPVTDENTGNVININNRAHARSESGVVLVHEALKGSIQLLLPWARFHETYLNDAERRIHRKATGSFWSEIRQFVLGPTFFKSYQKFLDAKNRDSFVSSHKFYTEMSKMSELKINEISEIVSAMLSSAEYGKHDD
jgi:hypothetical protein